MTCPNKSQAGEFRTLGHRKVKHTPHGHKALKQPSWWDSMLCNTASRKIPLLQGKRQQRQNSHPNTLPWWQRPVPCLPPPAPGNASPSPSHPVSSAPSPPRGFCAISAERHPHAVSSACPAGMPALCLQVCTLLRRGVLKTRALPELSPCAGQVANTYLLSGGNEEPRNRDNNREGQADYHYRSE